jgi:selenocysteine lyase/cysteine desulfurase
VLRLLNCTDLIFGYDKKVPTNQGYKNYINFDNAASTPPFKGVIHHLLDEAEWYASIHRGTGFKSKYSTDKYEEARITIGRFVGADLDHDVVIFTKNTTDSIHKVSHYLSNLPGEIVIYTRIEHHSNELPWQKFPSICLELRNGELDLNLLEGIFKNRRGQIKLLAVSGASNVTGYTPPIHSLAELAHEYGAKILVDGAQLVPHRPVNMYPSNDPRHLDFLAFSGHKMYAPFGTGVLIGPRSFFKNLPPSEVGGGTVKGISPQGVIWTEPPDVEEAGSPNVLGVVAIAKAAEILTNLGWPKLVEHENNLLAYTLKKLESITELIIYNHNLNNRIGVISFNVTGASHYKVAKYLADSRGIGVRNGCFCARSYVRCLLDLNDQQAIEQFGSKNEETPGMVRISFGCYNQLSEVDILIAALKDFLKTIPV